MAFYHFILKTLHNLIIFAAFMTDTDISGHADMRERELQPWVPEGDVSLEMNLK